MKHKTYKCIICNKEFIRRADKINKYCSKQCQYVGSRNKITPFKKCTRCGDFKQRSEFPIDKRNHDGIRESCKTCINQKRYEYEKSPQGKITSQKYRTSVKGRLQQKINREKHFHKRKARWILQHAVDSGEIKKTNCTHCGSNIKLQAHHVNYNEPLNVIWLCMKCHKKLHKQREVMPMKSLVIISDLH